MNMTGSDLKGWVLGTALAAGWLAVETPREAGAPDLFLVRDGILLGVWAKASNAKTTAANEAWIDALAKTAAKPLVWRPAQLRDAFSILTAP